MDALWDAEIGVIVWIQAVGRWLESPMQVVDVLGSQSLMLALLPLVFWCVHARLGARLSLLLLGSTVINGAFKALCQGARPYWFDSSVIPMNTEPTFGVPSGHAQTGAALGGYAGAKVPWRWSWSVAGVVIGLIAFSRVYLGVHFLSDVLVGLAVGFLLLWLMLRYESTVVRWWRERDLALQVGLAFGLSLVPMAAAGAWQVMGGDWTAPAAWSGAVPTQAETATLESMSVLSGAFFGTLGGFSVLAARGWYSAEGQLTSRVTRYVVGITGVVLIMVVLQLLVPTATGVASTIADYVGYLLIAVWMALGAPELFLRMGLAQRPTRQAEAAERA